MGRNLEGVGGMHGVVYNQNILHDILKELRNTVLKCLILLLFIIVFILIRGEKCGNKQMFIRV